MIIDNLLKDKKDQDKFSQLHDFMTKNKIPVSMIIGSLKVFDFTCPDCKVVCQPIVSEMKTFFGLGEGVEFQTKDYTKIHSESVCMKCNEKKLGDFICTQLPIEW